MNDKQEQVIQQCRAVAHLATALARVHQDYAVLMQEPNAAKILDQVGQRTAHFMEVLGDMLNGMDAVSEEDAWLLTPVFEKAHQMWPQAEERAGDE